MSQNTIKNLIPNQLYSFYTAGGNISKSVTPHVYLEMLNTSDRLRKINIVLKDKETTVWQRNGGVEEWDTDFYSNVVFSILDLINKHFNAENVTNEQFITQAIEDGLTPIDAVNSWLSNTLPNTKIVVSRHIKDMLDIELTAVSGELSNMRRVVIEQAPSNGDVFNVYYGETSKGGAVFDRDVFKSVTNYLRNIEEDIVEKPCDEYLAIYKRAQDVALCIVQNQGFSTSPCVFSSTHEDIRVRNAFKTACDILEMLQQHEMSDIVEEVEAYRQSQS